MAWIVGYVTKTLFYNRRRDGGKGLGNMERRGRFSRVKGFEWEHV
jgi:hypothetical protein